MILYTKNCSKCIILEKKLKQKGISFTTESNNFQKLIDANIDTVPVLEVNDELLTFNDAIDYINSL